MSENQKFSYEKFREKFASTQFSKPYIPIIIKKLVEVYPKSISKGVLANTIRETLNDNDMYEQFRIWDTLTDYYKFTNEESGSYSLNINKIDPNQILELQKICDKKINNPNYTNYQPLISKDIPHANTESVLKAVQEPKRTLPTSNLEQYNTYKNYFLVRINVNLQDRISINRAQNHSIEIPLRDRRKYRQYENKSNKAILFDIKQKFISIWGTADLILGGQRGKNIPYVRVSNFKPISPSVNGKIEPKWLREQLGTLWSPNRKIRKITHENYNKILSSCVNSNELFTISEPQIPETKIENSPISDLPLEIPTKETLEKGIQEIQNILLIDKKTIEEIVIHLASGRHVLLAGPIGTGKTKLAELIPKIFWNHEERGYDTQSHTASNEWSIHDVIGGIVPRMKDGSPTYLIQRGCVTETVERSWRDKSNSDEHGVNYRGTWLVIDEFNRAEIDKAFGQLFTALESKILHVPDEKKPILTDLRIPLDYRIIGTLNTSDKHYLFKLSDALKRRFAYVEVKSPRNDNANLEIYYALLHAINEISSDVSQFIKLDKNGKKLLENESDAKLVSAIKSAYEILSFVRMTKDMGTAILKSIYQTMLVGSQIKGYDDSILDMALHGNLITQLEKLESTNIEVLANFCFDDLQGFFRKIHNAQDDDIRQKYSDDFEYFLRYLKIPNSEKIKNSFIKQNIDDDTWKIIYEQWSDQKAKNKLPRNMPMFQTALEDLKKTFEFL